MSVRADAFEMILELRDYRDLLYQLTLRDLLLRYKQTVMGFAWAIFMPLVNTAVFSVIFTRVTKVDSPVPYPLFAYSGLLAWNMFASTLRSSVISLTSNASLVTKAYFPREILPFSALGVALVDSAVGSTVLIALMAWYHVWPSKYILLLPVVIVVHVVLTAAVALLVAMGNLFYRDVKYLFEVAITICMFTTSVLYPVRNVPGRLGLLLRLNPMSAIIDAYRDVLFGSTLPPSRDFGIAAGFSVLLLLIVWFRFHRAEFEFAERI